MTPPSPSEDTLERSVGDILEIEASDLLGDGKAVGRADGLVIFVWGPLPGERARVRLIEMKPRYAVAELVELLSTSPDRREPFCPVFGECGGCQVQHLAYEAQLAWKRTVTEQALRRIGNLDVPEVPMTIGMREPRGYRNKMALVAGGEDGARSLGFYAAGTHDLVPITTCPVVVPALQRDLATLNAVMSDPVSGSMFAGVRHIVVRRASGTGQGVLAVTTKRPSKGFASFAGRLLTQFAGMCGITNTSEPASENAILGRRADVVAGRPEMEETLGKLRFRVSVQSFFQVNVEIVERIFEALAADFTSEERIIDLYCGAGTFSVFFASRGARVVGFEENPLAVEEAHANAELNGVAKRTSFSAGRVEDLLSDDFGRAALAAATSVFLDPPRKGSDEATLHAIAASKVTDVRYLSCNPATLARDCAILAERGFKLTSVQPFDMFPQTGHVEVLAHLRRSASI